MKSLLQAFEFLVSSPSFVLCQMLQRLHARRQTAYTRVRLTRQLRVTWPRVKEARFLAPARDSRLHAGYTRPKFACTRAHSGPATPRAYEKLPRERLFSVLLRVLSNASYDEVKTKAKIEEFWRKVTLFKSQTIASILSSQVS